jgi:lysophospholipase L1-like esterase
MSNADMATDDRPRRWKPLLLKVGYIVVVTIVGLCVLEGAARYLGLGDPVLYYNDIWGGMRPLPNQHVSRLRGATVTVDANGFRTPVPEQPDSLRILYLGDSVTWGGTSIDDTALFTEVAADVLRAQGRPVYAMNSGVIGTSLLNHKGVFQDYDGKLDAVVWLFPWGDVKRSFAHLGTTHASRYKPRFALVEVIDHVVPKYWRRISRVAPPPEEDFRKIQRTAGDKSFFEKMLAERKERNLDAIRDVVAEAKQRGVPVILGVTPYRQGDALEPLSPEAVTFLDEMAAAGVTVFDVSAVLAQAPAGIEACYIDLTHLSAEGHQVVGQALGEELDEVLQQDASQPPVQENAEEEKSRA